MLAMVANSKELKKSDKTKKKHKFAGAQEEHKDYKNENKILFKRTLESEAELVTLDEKLRETLSVTDPNKDEAKKCLDRMAMLTVSGLILKKNPHVVDAIKKCRKYKYDAEIQEKADLVFKKFKLLFLVPENKDWDVLFAEKVKEFDEVCKNKDITGEKKIFLVSDPTHPSYNVTFLQMYKSS